MHHLPLQYHVPYLSPSVTHACMYAQRLANIHASPNSIKNYLSGARSWIREHRGNFQAFLSPQVAQLVKGFVKNSSHVPRRAAPLGAHHIQAICRFLDAQPSAPLAIKPAILIGFSCFLRSSNILSPTISQWGGPHTLLAADVSIKDSGLLILIHRPRREVDRRDSLLISQPPLTKGSAQLLHGGVTSGSSTHGPWALLSYKRTDCLLPQGK